ncbi:MAG: ribosome-associated translation inhibitor RaiA [Parvularculales bacterium]
MHIRITGIHIDTGEALRTYVQERTEDSITKYFDHPVNGHVTFAREGNLYRADCAVHLESGIVFQAQGQKTDIHASFDLALERLEKRLRRYKRRLKDHHRNNTRAE